MYCSSNHTSGWCKGIQLALWLSLGLAGLMLGSCAKIELYEKTVAIQGGNWTNTQTCRYNLEIPQDSMACWLQVSVRHTHLYPYRNLWIRLGLQPPGDSTYRYSDFNLALANNEQWLGLGMNDIYDRRVKLFDKPVVFERAGTAAFTIQHIMRENPLPGVLHLGLRIEPVP